MLLWWAPGQHNEQCWLAQSYPVAWIALENLNLLCISSEWNLAFEEVRSVLYVLTYLLVYYPNWNLQVRKRAVKLDLDPWRSFSLTATRLHGLSSTLEAVKHTCPIVYRYNNLFLFLSHRASYKNDLSQSDKTTQWCKGCCFESGHWEGGMTVSQRLLAGLVRWLSTIIR